MAFSFYWTHFIRVLFWRPKHQRKLFLHKIFLQPFGSWTSAPKIVDVRAKSAFSCGPTGGEKLLTPEHSGVRVRNVRGKSGPKNLCLCCFSSLMIKSRFFKGNAIAPEINLFRLAHQIFSSSRKVCPLGPVLGRRFANIQIELSCNSCSSCYSQMNSLGRSADLHSFGGGLGPGEATWPH